MTCISPPELDDGMLLLYLDGEADQMVAAHLEQCPHCRERAERLGRLQERMRAEMYRIDCPTSLELGEYHLGVLADAQARVVARHLKDCPFCSREVSQLKTYLGDLSGDLEFSLAEQVRVLVAKLVRAGGPAAPLGTPALAPAFAGLRGDEAGPRLYQAGEVQVDIEIQDDAARGDRKTLLGLVTGIDATGLVAHLWLADRHVEEAAVDELGNFFIPGLVPGSYELILSGPEVEVHIRDLDVGAS
jgi:anti-sigma factor RsiW